MNTLRPSGFSCSGAADHPIGIGSLGEHHEIRAAGDLRKPASEPRVQNALVHDRAVEAHERRGSLLVERERWIVRCAACADVGARASAARADLIPRRDRKHRSVINARIVALQPVARRVQKRGRPVRRRHLAARADRALRRILGGDALGAAEDAVTPKRHVLAVTGVRVGAVMYLLATMHVCPVEAVGINRLPRWPWTSSGAARRQHVLIAHRILQHRLRDLADVALALQVAKRRRALPSVGNSIRSARR